jgi:nucleolar complex protein 3
MTEPFRKNKEEKKGSTSKAAVPRQTKKILNFDEPLDELTPQQRIDLIAELSEAVLEDPQSAFASSKSSYQNSNDDTNYLQNHSKMRRLLELAVPEKNGGDQQAARLGTLSLLALFQDILPSYRIRLPTAAEKATRVSKETKKLWDYEYGLLTSYQQYLKHLNRTWEKSKGHKPSAFSVTAILCLCELLKSAPHMNFRSNILSVVVRQMNNNQCYEVSHACCKAVEHIFVKDAQGEVALEATRNIAKIIRDRGFHIRPEILRAFLALPLRVHEDEAEAAKLAAQTNAKRRKKDKETAEIEKDFREGEAGVDKIVLARVQSETLHTVTLTYFRILKAEGIDEKKVSILLPPTLEGLAKFSHLINIDTVTDVLSVLRGLLKRDDIPLDASLNCVMTAFQTLQGPGKELQIDEKEYVIPLYSLLPRLSCEGNCGKNTDLMIKCLTLAFIRRKEFSTVRVAAFVKQLCTTCLHSPSFTSAPLLAFVRQMIIRYPSIQQLLENEQDVVTSGAYTPDAEDPEHTNPFATSAWELATLKFQMNPFVVNHAKGILEQRTLQLPAEDPARIRSDLVENSKNAYVGQRVSQKKHPLLSTGSNKRKREQMRFITPRETRNYHIHGPLSF